MPLSVDTRLVQIVSQVHTHRWFILNAIVQLQLFYHQFHDTFTVRELILAEITCIAGVFKHSRYYFSLLELSDTRVDQEDVMKNTILNH